MRNTTWASSSDELMGARDSRRSGWRYVGWLALVCLGLSFGFHLQFYNSDRAEMLRALVGSYVPDTDFIYEIGPDRVMALGHVVSPSGTSDAKAAYKLVYDIDAYDSPEALAESFAEDKRKLRAGEHAHVAGRLSLGTTNRELRAMETVAYYGLMPGMFYSKVPFIMIVIGALGSAVMLCKDSKSGKMVCLGSLLMIGLSLPSFFPQVMISVTEPYVMVEHSSEVDGRSMSSTALPGKATGND